MIIMIHGLDGADTVMCHITHITTGIIIMTASMADITPTVIMDTEYTGIIMTGITVITMQVTGDADHLPHPSLAGWYRDPTDLQLPILLLGQTDLLICR